MKFEFKKITFGLKLRISNFTPPTPAIYWQLVNPRKQGSVVWNADAAPSHTTVAHLTIETFAHIFPEILQLIAHVLILL